MTSRIYYSARTGKNPNVHLDLPILLKLLKDLYVSFNAKEYFRRLLDTIALMRDSSPEA